MFELDPKLSKDTIYITKLKLCHVLLMNNTEFPWVILVPEKENISEWVDLDTNSQINLHKESCYIQEILLKIYPECKLNVANIGNIVKQFHIHHVVRYRSDSLWPKPVWGVSNQSLNLNLDLMDVRKKILSMIEQNQI